MFLGRSIGKRQRRNIYTRTDIQSVDSHHSLKVGVMKLSIRWLAIDSFDHKTFSEKSDIWSFAVTMWEIFTNGLQPYAGTPPVLSFYPCVAGLYPRVSDDSVISCLCGDSVPGSGLPDVLRMVRAGTRLERPARCPFEVFDLMEACWVKDRTKRPDFAQVRLAEKLLLPRE